MTSHASRIAAQLAMREDHCSECGTEYVREGRCRRCPECGYSPDCARGERA